MSAPSPRLVFVIGPPRGGTTLLRRMLHAHPHIHAPPEPHLIPPLAHLGYFGGVHKADHDPIQTRRAHADLVRALPGGEADYLAALRACADRIYGDLARAAEAPVLVDKTPANALVLPVLARLYPEATYVVLTRHPFAVWASYARSFFDDDWEVALAHNPVLARYVPAIGGFLRAPPVERVVHLTYEALVADPERALEPVAEAVGVEVEPSMITYGDVEAPTGLGDPVGVDRARRPVTSSVHAWAGAVADRPDRRAFLDRLVRGLDDADLKAWGHPRATLWDPLAGTPPRRPRRRWDRHHLERAALVALRRNVHHTPLGRALRRARFALDVLLRE